MPQYVQIGKDEYAEFPDNMPREQIESILQAQYSPKQPPVTEELTESVRQPQDPFAAGAVGQDVAAVIGQQMVNTVKNAGDILYAGYQATTNPVATAKEIGGLAGGLVEAAIRPIQQTLGYSGTFPYAEKYIDPSVNAAVSFAEELYTKPQETLKKTFKAAGKMAQERPLDFGLAISGFAGGGAGTMAKTAKALQMPTLAKKMHTLKKISDLPVTIPVKVGNKVVQKAYGSLVEAPFRKSADVLAGPVADYIHRSGLGLTKRHLDTLMSDRYLGEHPIQFLKKYKVYGKIEDQIKKLDSIGTASKEYVDSKLKKISGWYPSSGTRVQLVALKEKLEAVPEQFRSSKQKIKLQKVENYLKRQPSKRTTQREYTRRVPTEPPPPAPDMGPSAGPTPSSQVAPIYDTPSYRERLPPAETSLPERSIYDTPSYRERLPPAETSLPERPIRDLRAPRTPPVYRPRQKRLEDASDVTPDFVETPDGVEIPTTGSQVVKEMRKYTHEDSGPMFQLREMQEIKRWFNESSANPYTENPYLKPNQMNELQKALIDWADKSKSTIEKAAVKKGFKDIAEWNKRTQISKTMAHDMKLSLNKTGRNLLSLADLTMAHAIDKGLLVDVAVISGRKFLEQPEIKSIIAKKLRDIPELANKLGQDIANNQYTKTTAKLMDTTIGLAKNDIIKLAVASTVAARRKRKKEQVKARKRLKDVMRMSPGGI